MPFKPDKAPLKRNRPSSTARGYDHKHRKHRAELLRLYPLCQICGQRWSVQAHHLRTPATCIEDYQALCIPCHAKITGGRR